MYSCVEGEEEGKGVRWSGRGEKSRMDLISFREFLHQLFFLLELRCHEEFVSPSHDPVHLF
jgi:hypothetical protein